MSYGSGNSGDYKKLKGQMIQVTDTDPAVAVGAWSRGGNLNTARQQMGGSGASQTAALAFGGRTPGGAVANTEEWTVPESISNLTITD